MENHAGGGLTYDAIDDDDIILAWLHMLAQIAYAGNHVMLGGAKFGRAVPRLNGADLDPLVLHLVHRP